MRINNKIALRVEIYLSFSVHGGEFRYRHEIVGAGGHPRGEFQVEMLVSMAGLGQGWGGG